MKHPTLGRLIRSFSLGLICLLTTSCGAQVKENKTTTPATSLGDSDPVQLLRDSLILNEVIPKDTLLRRTIFFKQAVLLPSGTKESKEFVARISKWPAKTIGILQSAEIDSSVLDMVDDKGQKPIAKADSPRVAELRKKLFTDGTTPTEAYASFLKLNTPLEALERSAAEKEPDDETKLSIQNYKNRINALIDSKEIAANHKEFTSLTRETASEATELGDWANPLEDWFTKNGYTGHELNFGTESEKSAFRLAIRFEGVKNEPITPIPGGKARIIGLILMKQPEITLQKQLRKTFISNVRDAWSNKRDFWFSSLPVLSTPKSVWEDDSEVNLHVSLTDGVVRWHQLYIYGITVQTSPNK